MKSFLIILFLLIVGGSFLYYYKNAVVPTVQKTSDPTSSPLTEKRNTEITAAFKIITNGTTRIFTDSKYHNLSKDTYITSQNPSVIVINKENITWADFFKTLPMSLDKNCLITGTKQTFCTNENKNLYFYINNIETEDALNRVINQDDYLLVEYK